MNLSLTTLFQLVKLSGLSVYWNPYLPEQTLVRNKTGTTVWRNLLRNSIDAHRILDEEFDFSKSFYPFWFCKLFNSLEPISEK